MKISNADFFSWVEDELLRAKSVSITVKGFSMMPLIRNNKDSVRIEPCRAEDLKSGDIVLFRYKGAHVLHRYIQKEGDTFIMRGDNVFTHCEGCKGEDIIGRVISITRGGRIISPNSKLLKPIIILWRARGWIRAKIIRLSGRF